MTATLEEMAREAGFATNDATSLDAIDGRLARFAALVRAQAPTWPDRYALGDAILRAWKKHGQDSWCSIADDVLRELGPNRAEPYSQPVQPAPPLSAVIDPEYLARRDALVRAQARAEALEDAARVCVALSVPVRPADDYDMPPGPYQCAAAIRALPAKP